MIEFLRTCTVPLVAEVGGNANVVGTGTLFDFGDGPLLITAAHVLQGSDYGIKDLAMPETPSGTAMDTFGSFDLRKEVRRDIAILHFNTSETARRAKANWRVLSGNDMNFSLEPGLMAIAGCPRERVKVRSGLLHAGWIAVFAEPFTGEEDPLAGEFGLAQDFDLLSTYPTTVFRHDGTTTAAPSSIEALSGGSVWQLSGSVEGIWTPQKALRVVGLQVNAVPSKYMRARSWKVVSAVYNHSV